MIPLMMTNNSVKSTLFCSLSLTMTMERVSECEFEQHELINFSFQTNVIKNVTIGLDAMQIICDTSEGEWCLRQCHHMTHVEGRGSTKVSRDIFWTFLKLKRTLNKNVVSLKSDKMSLVTKREDKAQYQQMSHGTFGVGWGLKSA